MTKGISPLEVAAAYGAIANGGIYIEPKLYTKVLDMNSQIFLEKKSAVRQVLSDSSAYIVTNLLQDVINGAEGSGGSAKLPNMAVAGKTGTSQVGEYDFGEENYVDEYQLAFCGYFPADKPKYSMIVSINKLGLPASGGGMAGVVFHYIMNWIITHDLLPLLIIDDETNDTIHITESTLNKAYEILNRQENE